MNLRNFAVWGVIILAMFAAYALMGPNVPGAANAAASGAPASRATARPAPPSSSALTRLDVG